MYVGQSLLPSQSFVFYIRILYYVFILAIAEESNDDDSSSQGAPSEDILSNG